MRISAWLKYLSGSQHVQFSQRGISLVAKNLATFWGYKLSLLRVIVDEEISGIFMGVISLSAWVF